MLLLEAPIFGRDAAGSDELTVLLGESVVGALPTAGSVELTDCPLLTSSSRTTTSPSAVPLFVSDATTAEVACA